MFDSTEEAVAFGLQASKDERELMSLRRILFLRDFDLAMEREDFDQASIFATRAQFCREALEAIDIVKRNPELF